VTNTWLTTACPKWCVANHRENDLPDDRLHFSAWLSPIPLNHAPPVGEHRRVLLVYVEQHVDEDGPRVILTEEHGGQQELRLSSEEACDLGSALLHGRTVAGRDHHCRDQESRGGDEHPGGSVGQAHGPAEQGDAQ
jgi:hypothetical protein